MLTPFLVSRVRFDRDERNRGAETQLVGDSNLFSADALSIVAQPTRSTVLLPRPDRGRPELCSGSSTRPTRSSGRSSPGFLLLVGGVVFLTRRDRRRSRSRWSAAVMWVLALGPSLKFGGDFVWEHAGKPVSWLPYRLVLAVPALGALRAPFRTGYVLVAVLVAAPPSRCIACSRTGRGTRSIVAIGSAVLLATNLLAPAPHGHARHHPGERARAAGDRAGGATGDTVLAVPADCDPTFVSYQVFHHAPVVGCAGSFAANPWSPSSPTRVPRRSPSCAATARSTAGSRPATRGRPLFGPEDLVQLRERIRCALPRRRSLGAPPSHAAQ